MKKNFGGLGSNLNKKEYKEVKEEIFRIQEGYCFGEWAVLNDGQRSSDALALEDSHLFYIEKEDFDLVLAVNNILYLFFYSTQK